MPEKAKPRGTCVPRGFFLSHFVAWLSKLRGVERALLPATATTTTAAATATTAARATATAAATTTAATATLALLRLIHAQRTTTHVLPIEGLDGALCVSTRHFHEAEATRTAGFTVIDQRNGFHGSMRLEQLAHLRFVRRERQVTYIDLCHDDTVSLKKPRARSPC